MQTITTLAQLQQFLNQDIVLPAASVTREQVELYGKLTGDWNDHNALSTEQFQKPAVQGLLSVSLFGGFHKSICKIEGTDPMIVSMSELKLIRPIFVDGLFTPVLTIDSVELVEIKKKHVKVIWLYELRNVDSKPLITSKIELRYYFFNKNS